jgi:hypothetical protein
LGPRIEVNYWIEDKIWPYNLGGRRRRRRRRRRRSGGSGGGIAGF